MFQFAKYWYLLSGSEAVELTALCHDIKAAVE